MLLGHCCWCVRGLSEQYIIGPPGIAMPKGLRSIAVIFFFFLLSSLFSTPILGGHRTNLNQTWTHIYLWLLFKKIGWTPPGVYAPRALGKKTLFRDQLWTSTEHISATEHDINNRKETCKSTGTTLYMPPNLVNFGPNTAENGWRVFAHPLNFRIGRHCQPYRMHVI